MNTRHLRMALMGVLSLLLLIGVAALLAWALIDRDELRESLEAGLADALEMDVLIGQSPSFGLWPGPSVSVSGIEISREGQMVASAEVARVRLGLWRLLTGNLRPVSVRLEQPELVVERHDAGVFNIYRSDAETDRGPLDPLSLRRLRLSDARLTYLDQASGLAWQFENCDLDLRNLHHAGGELKQLFATLSAEGELSCGSLHQDQFVMSDWSVEFEGDSGFFELLPTGTKAFGGELSGRLEVDLAPDPPEFSLAIRLSQFSIAEFMVMLEPEQDSSGMVDLELQLAARGRTWQDVRGSSTGSLNMRSDELLVEGHDLDDELDGYAATQRFNLIDVGAVVLAGPVGLVASRGYAFSGMLKGSGGSTRIDQMVSEWTIEDGVARARDVAFRTPENRLALTGALDFNGYRFDELKVAVLDRDGCSIVEQRITGRFRDPEVEQPNFLVSVVGPLLDLVERGLAVISDEDCEVFYTGSIAHP